MHTLVLECGLLESMKASLGQLDDFTAMLCGEQKVAVSVIKPILHKHKEKSVILQAIGII